MSVPVDSKIEPVPEASGGKAPGLGTFGGVFTPSILTILGVIMYLRFGWVVGSVGLAKTFLIVTLATSITLVTALSISAISTAQRVKVGGAYYMISRSLGIETGGAVGISLFIAQALSIALYTIGFAESVVRSFPSLDEKVVGILTTTLVAFVALKSARAAIRAQYFIMGAIGLSLLSLAFGHSISTPEAVAASQPSAEPFWIVFAVFFPAVTGIMAGVNMSGDLEKPHRSIPIGTLAAVGVGYMIYMAIPLFLVTRATSEQLVSDPLVMRRIAFWGDAILIGVWGATLSSAVGSILGAPRVLQALARDRVLPASFAFLGRGSGPDDEPRIGTAVTFIIAVTTVVVGNLNAIAPILTMFFLTTYGILNVAAGLEQFLGNPSYRPVFRVHWAISLLGAAACVAVMFLINGVATVIAFVVVIGIYFTLERRELKTAWGDVRRGVWTRLASAGLFRLAAESDPKNWRPHVLVFSGAPTRRWHLIDLARSLTHNRALMTVSTVISTEGVSSERIQTMEETARQFIRKRGVRTLVRFVVADRPFEGVRRLVSTYGLGALVPNTVILGDSETPEVRADFCDLLSHLHDARRNAVVVHHNPKRGFGRRKRIDVWWGGLRGNGSLMMILAYLVGTSLEWRGANVRIKIVVPSSAAAKTTHVNLTRIIDSLRTGARTEVYVADGRPFDEILRESSRDSDLVFLGLAEPGSNFVEYYERVQERIKDLPTTCLVLASEDLSFGDVLRDTES